MSARHAWLTIRSRPRESGVASICLVIAVSALALSARPDGDASRWPAAVVREGKFVDAVVETGEVNAARLMLYGAPVGASQSKIVWIVPEGTLVETGDELVRFDDSAVRQDIDREQAALRRDEADLVRAQEDLRIERLRVQSEVEALTQAVAFAERELTNQMEGQGRLTLLEAQAAAAEAERERDRTRAAYEDTRALLPEGFVTRLEVDKAEQAYRRAEELLRLANVKVETLTKYERPSTIDQSMAAVNAAHGDLRRGQDAASSRVTQRDAAVASARSRVDETRSRLESLRDRLARSVVHAGGSGLVVYRDLFFGSDRRKPQVGDEVWPNQPVIALPDSSRLVVETHVREIDLYKIAASQRVQVRFDAYPDLVLPASVSLVGALAQDDDAKAGTKYFPVTVELLQTDERLRTGMTAQVEIEVASKAGARLIPVEAVFGDEHAPYAFVLVNGRPARRPITIDASNGFEAAVLGGLDLGERVLLVDPTATAREGAP